METINVRPIAAVIDDMANTLDRYAIELRSLSQNILNTNDLSITGEAITAIANCIGNLRMDLLVTRSLREFIK